ncbi:MAG: FAD:protein FMN transferase, partial [Thermoleophilaceae bacterium]|nr:FAD:protein FMN transferase [Thermoleophilaceae bacterium]
MSSDSVHSFICMGTRMSLWIEPDGQDTRRVLIDEGVELLRDFEQRFTRFDANSELSRLNASPISTVPVSAACVAYLSAALWAAEFSGGMVDPTLLQAIKANGYEESRSSDQPIQLVAARQALELTKQRHAGSANPAAPWRQVQLDAAAGTVTRPAGLQFDAGGTGKGYAADTVASLFEERLPAGTRWFVDCGGDLRLSEVPVGQQPHSVDVEHPLTGQLSHRFQVWGGAIATSGISR